MSIKAMARVWGYRMRSITDKLVLLAYVDHADHDGRNIFPAVQSIAEKTGASRRTVQRATRRLVEAGLLIPDPSAKYSTNRWRLDMDWGGRPADAPPTQRAQADEAAGAGKGRTGDAPTEKDGGVRVTRGGRNGDAGGGVTDDLKGRTGDALTVINHPINRQLNPLSETTPTGGPKPHPIRDLLAGCEEIWGYKVPHGAKEAKAAQTLLKRHSPEVILGCLRYVNGDPWQADKHVGLQLIIEKVGPWQVAGSPTRQKAGVAHGSVYGSRRADKRTGAPGGERAYGDIAAAFGRTVRRNEDSEVIQPGDSERSAAD